ncbi:ABC transporter ATP-binding protein [Zhihengliuella somnathii]
MVDIAIDQLTFSYRTGEELFDGLSHNFTPGRVTALVGPSGRGKSTLLYVLGLLLTPRSGAVQLRGQNAAVLPDRERARLRAAHFGFVFQDAVLDPQRPVLDSVIEPALYAGRTLREARGSARILMEQLGVDHRAHHKPGQVSGGQAQRIAVCRALVNNPSVILADEPTGNLDRESAASVLTALRTAAETDSRTVVIATHDPFVMEYSDEVLSL